ncbi:MAG: hypothetical protein B6D68_02545 [spirochete symbiont of Stewartia floridana]|nr:MAG: hypothetical protein B6D68_02545 [spirochete symbiont of Stewartia floridana]
MESAWKPAEQSCRIFGLRRGQCSAHSRPLKENRRKGLKRKCRWLPRRLAMSRETGSQIKALQ